MNEISKFFKQPPFNMMMFGWVYGLKLNMPSCTIEQAIGNFMKNNNLQEDVDVNVHTLTSIYRRMLSEYMDVLKTKKEDEKNQVDKPSGTTQGHKT
jgi:hypothetical protein